MPLRSRECAAKVGDVSGEVHPLMRASALLPRECGAGDQDRQQVDITQLRLSARQHRLLNPCHRVQDVESRHKFGP